MYIFGSKSWICINCSLNIEDISILIRILNELVFMHVQWIKLWIVHQGYWRKWKSCSLSAKQKQNKKVGDLGSLEMKHFEWFLGTQQYIYFDSSGVNCLVQIKWCSLEHEFSFSYSFHEWVKYVLICMWLIIILCILTVTHLDFPLWQSRLRAVLEVNTKILLNVLEYKWEMGLLTQWGCRVKHIQ